MRLLIVVVYLLLCTGCSGLQAGEHPDGSKYIRQTGFFPVKGKLGDSELDTKMWPEIDINGIKGG